MSVEVLHRDALATKLKRVLPWVGMGLCLADPGRPPGARPGEPESRRCRDRALGRGRDKGGRGTKAQGGRQNPATTVTLSDTKLQAAKITTEPARMDKLATELGVPGRIEVNSDRRIEIRSRAAGVVREVHVVLGQDVKRGDPLVTLDSPDVGTARLNLRARQRELSTARVEAEWKSQVAATVALLIPEIRKGTDPSVIEKEFGDKPLGAYRGSHPAGLRRVRHRGPRGGEDRRPPHRASHRRAPGPGRPAHAGGAPGQALRDDRAGQVRRRPGEAAGRPAAPQGRIRRDRRGPAAADPGRLGEYPRPARARRQGRRARGRRGRDDLPDQLALRRHHHQEGRRGQPEGRCQRRRSSRSPTCRPSGSPPASAESDVASVPKIKGGAIRITAHCLPDARLHGEPALGRRDGRSPDPDRAHPGPDRQPRRDAQAGHVRPHPAG